MKKTLIVINSVIVLSLIALLIVIAPNAKDYEITQTVVVEPITKKYHNGYKEYDVASDSARLIREYSGLSIEVQVDECPRLITKVFYKNHEVFSRNDKLSDYGDTIKCFRYNEALKLIEEIIRIDEINCEK